jgi:uncharacterized protein
VRNKIILGTVQFGTNYGINNLFGKPDENQVCEILDTAYLNGIDCLDTADAYGTAASTIGEYHRNRNFTFKILSKFLNVEKGTLRQIARSALDLLHIEHFEVYSFHSFNEYINNQSIIDELLELKSEGLVRKVGITIYTNEQLAKVIQDPNIEIIQIPFNILDNIFIRGDLITEAKTLGKIIHARSVFLQGLIFMNENSVPEMLTPLKPYLQKIKGFCNSESVSLSSLSLSYAVYNKNIDNVLIGVETQEQLLQNLSDIHYNQKAFDFIDQNIRVKETDLLNPVNWK